MTVSTDIIQSPEYVGDGVLTELPFNFYHDRDDADSYVKLFEKQADGSYVQSSLPFSVIDDTSDDEAGIIILDSPLAAGVTVTVVRDTLVRQYEEIPQHEKFYPKVYEKAFDKLTCMIQELARRAFKLPVGAADNTNIQSPFVPGNYLKVMPDGSLGWASAASTAGGYADADVTALNLTNGVRNSVGYRAVQEIRSLSVPVAPYEKVSLYGEGGSFDYYWDALSTQDDDGINVLILDSNTNSSPGRYLKSIREVAINNTRRPFVEKARTQSWVGRSYLKSTGSNDFQIGFEHEDLKAAEYILNYNPEGFLWMGASYTGDSIGEYIKPELVGSFVNSTTNNMFANSVGESFNFSFEGTGFYFNSLRDTRGGMWSFSVDGGAGIDISVYSPTTISQDQQLVVSGLVETTHNVVATYQGADPSNPPSSGGVGRGWITYDSNGTGVSTIDTISTIQSPLNDKGAELSYSSSVTKVMGSGTVLDFAIKAKPSGSLVDPKWVPYHSSATVGNSQRNITLEIYKDGVLMDNNIGTLNDGVPFETLTFKQNYTAYNGDDPGSTPLWEGYFTHHFESGVLTTSHSIKILTDVFVESGYLAGMFAAQSSAMGGVKYSNGIEYDQLSNLSGVKQSIYMDSTPASAAFQSSLGGFSAVDVDLQDVLSLGRLNSFGPESIFLQSRTSDLIKCYWQSFNNDILPAGETYRASARYYICPNISTVF